VSDPTTAGIAEEDLPGIGRRYTLTTTEGARLCVVLHHGGRRDVYLTEEGGDTPAVATLDDDEARRIGAILAGAYFTPAAVRRVEAVVGGLLVDWVTVRPGSALAGRSIGDAAIRQRTRITVVAIVRDDEPIVAPEPDEVLAAGDRLVVIGRPEDLPGFLAEMIDPS